LKKGLTGKQIHGGRVISALCRRPPCRKRALQKAQGGRFPVSGTRLKGEGARRSDSVRKKNEVLDGNNASTGDAIGGTSGWGASGSPFCHPILSVIHVTQNIEEGNEHRLPKPSEPAQEARAPKGAPPERGQTSVGGEETYTNRCGATQGKEYHSRKGSRVPELLHNGYAYSENSERCASVSFPEVLSPLGGNVKLSHRLRSRGCAAKKEGRQGKAHAELSVLSRAQVLAKNERRRKKF